MIAFYSVHHRLGSPRRLRSMPTLGKSLLEFYPKMASIKGYGLPTITLDAGRRKLAVEYVVKGLASGALKPVIDRTFKFDEMVEVHRYLESNGQFGKIVVTV